jgi:hypothetical protein
MLKEPLYGCLNVSNLNADVIFQHVWSAFIYTYRQFQFRLFENGDLYLT